MKKKILAALICAALALNLTACANNEEPEDTASKKDKSSKSSVTSVSNPSDSDNSSAGSSETSSTTDSKPEESKPGETSTPAVDSGIDWDSVPYADELDFMCKDYDANEFAFKDEWDAIYTGGVYITEYTGSEKLIKIPETIDGKPVVGICGKDFGPMGSCFCNLSNVSVRIPDNVGFILKGFEECNNLTVDLPTYNAKFDGDYRSLRRKSFADCNNLKLNMEPNSVGAMAGDSGRVFDGCTFNGAMVMPDSLTSISEPTFHTDGYYYFPQVFPEAIVYKGKTYDSQHLGAFFDKMNFDESGMKIENGVLKKVSRAIEGTFTVPDNVTSIGKNAFSDCLDITEVIIPDSVTKIDGDAFNTHFKIEFNVTYKGKTYKFNQLGNLFKAVNGN